MRFKFQNLPIFRQNRRFLQEKNKKFVLAILAGLPYTKYQVVESREKWWIFPRVPTAGPIISLLSPDGTFRGADKPQSAAERQAGSLDRPVPA